MNRPTALAAFGSIILFTPLFFLLSCKKQDETFVSPSLSIKVVRTSPDKEQQNAIYYDSESATLNQRADTTQFHFLLSLSDGDTAIAGDIKIEDSTVTFLPKADLSPATVYTATLTLRKKGEVSPAYHYQWSFTTKQPDAYKMTQRSTHVTDFVRDGVMAMQVGEYYFTFGGWRDWPQSQNDVYRSGGDLSTWERVPNAPWHPRHVFGCIKKDGKVWVMGGDNLDNSWDLWNSEDGINWTKIGHTNPTPVGPREYAGYCTHKIGNLEWIYIVGGYGYTDILRSLDGIKWETVATNVAALTSPEIPIGEGFSGAVTSLNGKLYLVCGGGGTAWGPARKSVFCSADNGLTWQRMPDLPGAPRRYTNVTVFDGKIWVIGGYDDNSVGNLRDIWYMTEKGTWQEFPTPADYVARHATGIGVYNNQLVITCGDYNNDCWVIEKVK